MLSALDGARDALVTAINAKGGSLAQDSTLYQCANAVNEISTGTDTSDATATASDILQDKTAYAKDEKITGTIPTVTASMSDNVVTVPKGYVKSAQTLTVGTALNAFTITPAANAQVISKGSYLKGEVTVAGDTNLTAANIKSGVTIFNVAGTYEGESTGGTSAEYYKCASVDTEAKTWSGYKAVFDSTAGTWGFEDMLTEGLTYTSVTPQVGSTYNADATLTVMLHGLLFSDIIAYYKFDDNLNNYVGQYGTATSNNTTYVDGKSGKALLFNGSTSKCIVPKDISVRGRSRVSVSLWFNINSFGNKNVLYAEENKKTHFFRFGLEVLSTGNILGALRNFDSDATYKSIDGGSVSLQEWHFAVFTFDAHSQIAKLHVDGVLKGTVATSSDPIPDTAPARTISVGYFDGSSSSDTGVIDGMIDELCIWSKALTDAEVSELYNNGAGKFL